MKNIGTAPQPNVGDIIEIAYNGEIAESYPAQITEVYGIKVVKEAEQWDLIPMVMVNGELYIDTGHESTVEARCGVMDGEITSEVDGSEKPTKDNQSNFGTGYGYQSVSYTHLYCNNAQVLAMGKDIPLRILQRKDST